VPSQTRLSTWIRRFSWSTWYATSSSWALA
jgi:hypothetical protein